MDLNVRMPSMYKEKEMGLRAKVAKRLGRGKSEISINIDSSGEDASYTVNKNLAELYYRDLKDLAEKIGQPEPSYLEVIMKMPDVLRNEKSQLDEEEWKEIDQTADRALDALTEFRDREGAVLLADFESRIAQILDLLKQIETFEDERIKNVRERLDKNLEEWVGNDTVDRNRFEQELIYYLEKLDITEEKVRLKTHCNYFIETLSKGDGQGKKLGFISQEIGREINTTGSKANHAGIQKLVVQMKDELEKIKEQMLNVL